MYNYTWKLGYIVNWKIIHALTFETIFKFWTRFAREICTEDQTQDSRFLRGQCASCWVKACWKWHPVLRGLNKMHIDSPMILLISLSSITAMFWQSTITHYCKWLHSVCEISVSLIFDNVMKCDFHSNVTQLKSSIYPHGIRVKVHRSKYQTAKTVRRIFFQWGGLGALTYIDSTCMCGPQGVPFTPHQPFPRISFSLINPFRCRSTRS